MKRLRSPFALSAAAIVVLLCGGPAAGQVVVHDPTNHVQNVIQAARALEQINNQIQSLQNEATALMNQARNLTSLPYSSLRTLQGQVERTRSLLSQAQTLAYDVRAIEAAFDARYGAVALSTSERDLVARARQRWLSSVAGFEDAMRVQAGVVQGLGATREELESLVSASQGAAGALQAAQAGNQLLALQSSQLVELTGLLAAQGRAEALDAADRAAARADAQARFRRFMGEPEQ
ncbi:P-type conjugative transfer protein TrbJ [Brevundimonas sp. CEF1]|jgi:P-type conjugative transfer protein TrbJ|uniref:P-type conjugative transfer protein TrbJ n=1 Tax=Brevundimonas sp. CEF1 TaxID=3442642 RepID=UPI003F5157D2